MANEKRLIDANALKERAIRVSTVKGLGNKVHCYIKAVGTHEIDKAPTVEAVEVVHGRWLPQKLLGERVWDCSKCKTLGSPQWRFCPVCGAKMDGGNEDDWYGKCD